MIRVRDDNNNNQGPVTRVPVIVATPTVPVVQPVVQQPQFIQQPQQFNPNQFNPNQQFNNNNFNPNLGRTNNGFNPNQFNNNGFNNNGFNNNGFNNNNNNFNPNLGRTNNNNNLLNQLNDAGLLNTEQLSNLANNNNGRSGDSNGNDPGSSFGPRVGCGGPFGGPSPCSGIELRDSEPAGSVDREVELLTGDEADNVAVSPNGTPTRIDARCRARGANCRNLRVRIGKSAPKFTPLQGRLVDPFPENNPPPGLTTIIINTSNERREEEERKKKEENKPKGFGMGNRLIVSTPVPKKRILLK